MQSVLKNIELLLTKKGKKRPWLSKESGVPLSTINNWYSYDRVPKLNDTIAVAEALGVDISLLLQEEIDASVARAESEIDATLLPPGFKRKRNQQEELPPDREDFDTLVEYLYENREIQEILELLKDCDSSTLSEIRAYILGFLHGRFR